MSDTDPSAFQTPTNPVVTEPGVVHPSDLSSSADAGPHDASSAERMGATSDERDLAELAHRAELPEHRPADRPDLVEAGVSTGVEDAPPADESVAADAADIPAEPQEPEQSE